MSVKRFTQAVALLMTVGLLTACPSGKHALPEIGPTEILSVRQSGLEYHARIDTGAVETSLHAIDMHVIDGVDDKKKNVGKTIEFTSLNEDGQSVAISAVIVETSRIRNSQGEEIRYMVELDVGYKGLERKIKVNLRDRSKMSYKLLIGRNWLKDNYVVNVALPSPK
ncbi:RimK/LysX family protein [Paraferrimonas sp. SM1919]|uniref:putative ATP-dependent zinc protease n=1 Tax=Paraferrimonas sp. SM1919 TaxID=2662263 RepID=UPI0013D2EE0F|nr:RimK/LysX family protein [Paraferrimonas sp. SM1919]